MTEIIDMRDRYTDQYAGEFEKEPRHRNCYICGKRFHRRQENIFDMFMDRKNRKVHLRCKINYEKAHTELA